MNKLNLVSFLFFSLVVSNCLSFAQTPQQEKYIEWFTGAISELGPVSKEMIERIEKHTNNPSALQVLKNKVDSLYAVWRITKHPAPFHKTDMFFGKALRYYSLAIEKGRVWIDEIDPDIRDQKGREYVSALSIMNMYVSSCLEEFKIESAQISGGKIP